MTNAAGHLLEPIRQLHERITASVLAACERRPAESLAEVAADDAGDTIYRIDRVAEALLVDGLSAAALEEPLLLLAEGLPPEGVPLPRGATEPECRWRILIDPIDGTRGLMYQKRSAWVLTGVAPNRGSATRLSDVVLAVQTEIPLLKQHLADQLWAMRGSGVEARRLNRLNGEVEALALHPSRAASLAHGFASVVRFFPGARGWLGAVDDAIAKRLDPNPRAGKAQSFEDQYASTGGQLYELMSGHDRLLADLRPLTGPNALCCHPYDLCTSLIAEELGVILTDARGHPLDAPFDLTADVAWIGYANPALRSLVEPALLAALRETPR